MKNIKQYAAQGNHKISGAKEIQKFPGSLKVDTFMAQKIEIFAEKEMFRMTTIFEKLKTANSPKAKHFFEFASNYFKDGIYFFKNKKFIESFEAFIIAWSYIDCGLKMKFFQVPKEQKEWFTTG